MELGESPMVKISIDGNEIEVPKGTTVIQAAEQVGIEIPRYCYHPGLSIVGVCRICLVEIERMPKLQVACYTPVTEGMVVHTNTPKVLRERSAVLEFLLVNHPLDCPVCDQAGECWLQNFYMQHGLYDSQMVENKVKKTKATPIGANVMLDSERCILCSRCVRFCDEISQTHELGIFNRGDHAELLPYPGATLDNKYSANTIDICPVGALTDRDFRFRTRVWYLKEEKSICTGCSQGCNINVHHNDDRTYKADGIRVSRLKPRYNAEVNHWWMCDAGRYGFTWVDAPSRLQQPQHRVGGELRETTWEEAIQEISTKLRTIIENHGADSIGVILSAQMTNEDLFMAKRLFNEGFGIEKIGCHVEPLQPGEADDFLIKADKNPNTQGARLLDIETISVEKLLSAAREKKLRALYICQHDLEKGFVAEEVVAALKGLELIIFQGTNETGVCDQADYVLPSAAFVEKEGTFTNYAQRVQRIYKAVAPLGAAVPDWLIFRRLARHENLSAPFFEVEDVFEAMAAEVAAFSGLTYENVGESGQLANAAVANEAEASLV